MFRFFRFIALASIYAALIGLNSGCHTPWASKRSALPVVNDSGGVLMREQSAYDLRDYDLQLRIFPDKKFIEGTATMEVSILASTSWLVLDLDTRLHVKCARISQQSEHEILVKVPHEQRGGKLWVFLGVPRSGRAFSSFNRIFWPSA